MFLLDPQMRQNLSWHKSACVSSKNMAKYAQPTKQRNALGWYQTHSWSHIIFRCNNMMMPNHQIGVKYMMDSSTMWNWHGNIFAAQRFSRLMDFTIPTWEIMNCWLFPISPGKNIMAMVMAIIIIIIIIIISTLPQINIIAKTCRSPARRATPLLSTGWAACKMKYIANNIKNERWNIAW